MQSSGVNSGGLTPALAAATAREHVIRGDHLYARGMAQAAYDEFASAVRLQPAVADYQFRLASAAWKLNRPAEVEAGYLQATRLDPKFAEAHKKLAQWYAQNRQLKPALIHSAKAMEIDSSDVDIRITRAVVLIADDQTAPAWEILRPIIDAGVVNWHLASAYGDLAHRIGHQAQAVALIEKALAGSNPSPSAARRLHVSAASLLESTGQFDHAFAHMRQAKERVSESFDPQAYEGWVSRSLAYFSKRKLRSLPRATLGSSRPVFIVGMPRSGTSLIEQILASHPTVHGGGELRLMGQIAESLAGDGVGYPDCLDRLSIRDANRLAGQYLDEIGKLNPLAIYVTDKMPQNYEHLGLIDILLPDCRVIHCRRDPRDTCLSCFLTDFDQGHAFSCTLQNLAAYYRQYRRQMNHWKNVLSVPILDVCYEEVISQPEAQVRRLLDFLQLPWDDACLRFHENHRTVTTASRDQVRQPIYATSVGRWKRYAANIPELLELAGD